MSDGPLRLAVVGASGRMGQAVLRVAAETPGVDVVARVSLGDDPALVPAASPHVAIDFSSPAGTRALAEAAARSPRAPFAIVCGTTGLDDAAERALAEASRRAAVFAATNMSVGVHVLGVLLASAISMLGPGFDLEIVEAHHRRKVDAPSGTALTLVDVARRARQKVTDAPARIQHGREGRPGERPADAIGVHAVRGGDVIGDHTALLLGDGERIELTHRASNRDLFARGAVRAALWVAKMPPGRYGMSDLVAG